MASNSWQQPVTSEPSCGEPHVHYYEVYNGDPASTAWTAVDISGQVPVGTKLVALHIDMASTDANDELSISNVTSGNVFYHLVTQQANQAVHGWTITPVQPTRYFVFKVDNTRVNSLIIRTTLYWC